MPHHEARNVMPQPEPGPERAPEDTLARIATVAREAEAPEIAAEADALAHRSRTGGFHLACIGQFKRGKSTLINALLGEPLLPTGVVPVTALPVVVRYGPRAARIRRQDQLAWEEIPILELSQYVTEEGNPGNRRQVAAVEVHFPSPLLRDGICFMDTPGLGSVFTWNTEKTHASVPDIDALLIVSGAEPPVTQEELILLERFADPAIPRLLVLNKADRSAPEAMEEASGFTRQVLAERLGWSLPDTFCISATDAMAGRDSPDWAALVERLRALARASGRLLADTALQRGCSRLEDRLRASLLSRRQSLLEPIATTEERIGNLRSTIERLRRSLRQLAPMLRMEEQQVGDLAAERRRTFLAAATPPAHAELRDALMRAPGGGRRAALDIAVRVARRRVLPWLEASEPVVERAYQASMARLTEELHTIVARAGGDTADLTALLTGFTAPEGGLSAPRRFYFLEYQQLTAPTGLEWLAQALGDAVLPRGVAGRRIERGAHRLLDRLLDVNSTRVQNDLVERVRETGRRLQSGIQSALRAALAAAEQDLVRTRQIRAAGASAVADEVARLDGLLASLPATP